MDWLLKVRRALLAFSARLKLRKSVGGLLKLQDDVQMCGYRDVQIMWNMLSKAQQEEIQIMATTRSPTKPNQKRRRQQRPSWCFRTFFGPATQSCVLVRLESDACSMLS
ncbi:hypothetical protein M0R45_002750 [Rubus argutus]|uniref:Uncharacterized protein n=1 Tax=Rubus argutus TaxID=59490 RepID=A0AAW1VSD5_RUBAR